MRNLPVVAFAALASLACAVAPQGTPPLPTSIWVRSHNRSEVDVYLLCGDRDARWLGLVPERGGTAFEVPIEQARCMRGLNFFLVVRKQGWGYWAGPVRPRAGTHVDLVIEKYAGLSTARLRTD